MGTRIDSGQSACDNRTWFRFLECYYDRTHAEEIAAMLGSLALTEDGLPMDSAVWADWLAAVGEETSAQAPDL